MAVVRFTAVGLVVKLVGGQWFLIVVLCGGVLAPVSWRVVDRRVEYGFLPVYSSRPTRFMRCDFGFGLLLISSWLAIVSAAMFRAWLVCLLYSGVVVFEVHLQRGCLDF